MVITESNFKRLFDRKPTTQHVEEEGIAEMITESLTSDFKTHDIPEHSVRKHTSQVV